MTELPLRVIRAAVPGPFEFRCRCGLSRPGSADSALIRLAAHVLGCEPGALRAAADPRLLTGEQPVRLIRYTRKGARPRVAFVCVCGAETAWWRWGSHSESVSLKTHFRWPVTGADLSLGGLGALLRHCHRCETARAWLTAPSGASAWPGEGTV